MTRLQGLGKRIKFLYTIPNYNNPSGISQPWERRMAVLQTCRELGLLVVEDNPYGLLSLDAEPVPAMRSVDPDVIYLGSFSKTFAPGFRVGWVLAPHGVREKLVLAQESATLCPPVFSQFAISNYLEKSDWQGQIAIFRDMYRERRDAMLKALADHMPPDTSWTHPTGGFFVWVSLPEGIDAQAMLPAVWMPASLLSRVPRSTPMARVAATCGCPTAFRRLSASRRVWNASPMSFAMSSTCSTSSAWCRPPGIRRRLAPAPIFHDQYASDKD